MSGATNHRQLSPTGVPYRRPGVQAGFTIPAWSVYGSLPVYKNVWRLRPNVGVVWSAAVPFDVQRVWAVPEENTVYVSGSSLACLNGVTGAVLWTSPVITYGVDRLFLHPSGGVIAVNIQRSMRIVEGSIVWSIPSPPFAGWRWGGVAVTANEIILGATNNGYSVMNYAYAFDFGGNQLNSVLPATGGLLKLAGGDLIGSYSSLRRWTPPSAGIWTNYDAPGGHEGSLSQPVAFNPDESRYIHARPHRGPTTSNHVVARAVHAYSTADGARQWTFTPDFATQVMQVSENRTVVSYGFTAHGVNNDGQLMWTRPDLGLVRDVNGLNQFVFAWPGANTIQSGVPGFSGAIPSVQLVNEAGVTLWSWESNTDFPNGSGGYRNIWDAAFYSGDIIAVGSPSARWDGYNS